MRCGRLAPHARLLAGARSNTGTLAADCPPIQVPRAAAYMQLAVSGERSTPKCQRHAPAEEAGMACGEMSHPHQAWLGAYSLMLARSMGGGALWASVLIPPLARDSSHLGE